MFEIRLNEKKSLKFDFFSSNKSSLLDKSLQDHFERGEENTLFYLATRKTENLSPSVTFWSDFTNHFIETVRLDPSIEELKDKSCIDLDRGHMRRFLNDAPFMPGGEYLDEDCLLHVWKRLKVHFFKEINSYNGSIEEYFSSLNPEIHLAGRVYFHLVENKDDEEYPFAFMATYLANVKNKEEFTHRPLGHALKEYRNDQEKMLRLLTTIKRATHASKLVAKLLDTGEIFSPLKFNARDAQQFLEETPLYIQAGVLCRIPHWWRSQAKGVRINFIVGEKASLFGANSLMDFKIELAVGDWKLGVKEAQDLLDESNGLAFLKGKWIKVDKENLANVLDKYNEVKELAKNFDISFHDAMKMLLGNKRSLQGLDSNEIEITRGKWLEQLMQKLENPASASATKSAPSKNFKGILRPYQRHGLNWLNMLHSFKFGGCLADDMGLGKTIQVLAFLQKIVEITPGVNLLILPASLLSNWVSEILKFSPSLKYFVAHPSSPKFNKLKNINQKTFEKYHIVITTYGFTRRTEWIKKINWIYVILDEAQAIKNPYSSQSKAVKSLKSWNRLVLTGTPIENQLGDLWSLFDFVNPGLLGSKKEFQNLLKGSEKRKDGPSKIKKVISPYILRRVKTDKAIISDLPDKIEFKSYVYLSKKQAVHYQKQVAYIKKSLSEETGIKRKGLILSSLMKFKQICNHPDQYLGSGNYKLADSGKYQKLKDICEIIFEKREKVLVFTQFREIIPSLDRLLQEISGKKGVFLHGGVSIKKRKERVQMFQEDESVPYFVLSLKAGGTGLNLTSANHVIHFDRWWNPAVENQATDRAFRIGQRKKVVVHKMITKATLEDKIDQMLKEKSKLFDDLMGKNQEIKLTEMSTEEVIDLVKMEQIF